VTDLKNNSVQGAVIQVEGIGKHVNTSDRYCEFEGAQVWDIRSLGFSWFLHHKVFWVGDFGAKILTSYFNFWGS
jgi:hypothetical protein